MKSSIMMASVFSVVAGCSGTVPPPPALTREMIYDLLALPPLGRVPAMAISAASDDFSLTLDGIVVTGLDQVVQTWATVTRGANVQALRHTITANADSSSAGLIESGRVVLTLQDKPTQPPRDTTMIFTATWKRAGNRWRLTGESITAR